MSIAAITGLLQLFIFDPSGVQLELTFDSDAERIPVPEISEDRKYRPGESFFDPKAYAGLAERIRAG